MSLELNECDPLTEFRCRQGTCIPRVMAFDKINDCSDASDEYNFVGQDEMLTQVFPFNLHVDNRCISGRWFPCDDPDGKCTPYLWTKPLCQSKRDLHFIQTLLGPSTDIETNFFWMCITCMLGFQHFFVDILEITTLQCKRLNLACPTVIYQFPFPLIRNHFLAYPSVKFLYYSERSFDESIAPDYICYDAKKCQHFFTPTSEQVGFLCNSWSEIMGNRIYRRDQWNSLIYDIRKIFSYCYLPDNHATSIDSHLFKCDNGSALISKHRVHDAYVDCINGDDEAIDLDSCAFRLTDRFQCKESVSRCIPRVLLLNGVPNCPDASDEISLYQCDLQDDYGCRWKRGSLVSNNLFPFFQICDGFVDVIYGNVTDETDCPQYWINECDRTWTQCNGVWDCRDGRDELGCNSTFFTRLDLASCVQKQQFFCINRTSGQPECYQSELAGNGYEDCVGGVDERVGGFCQHT